jgi:hypothetical protein
VRRHRRDHDEARQVGFDQLALRIVRRRGVAAGRAGLQLADDLLDQWLGMGGGRKKERGQDNELLDRTPAWWCLVKASLSIAALSWIA